MNYPSVCMPQGDIDIYRVAAFDVTGRKSMSWLSHIKEVLPAAEYQCNKD